MWVCGCESVWKCGHLGCEGMRVCGNVGVMERGCLGWRVCGCYGVWVVVYPHVKFLIYILNFIIRFGRSVGSRANGVSYLHKRHYTNENSLVCNVLYIGVVLVYI